MLYLFYIDLLCEYDDHAYNAQMFILPESGVNLNFFVDTIYNKLY